MLLSLNSLKDLEALRVNEHDRIEDEMKFVSDDASTVCSIEDKIDVEALNLICSEISEGLCDGGYDLCVYRLLYHKTKGHVLGTRKKRSRSR